MEERVLGSRLLLTPPVLHELLELLRQVLRRLLGSLEDIEWKHIEKMRDALALSKGKRVVLPRGLTFHVEKGRYRVTLHAPGRAP